MAKKHRIHPQGSQYIREAVPSPREHSNASYDRILGRNIER